MFTSHRSQNPCFPDLKEIEVDCPHCDGEGKTLRAHPGYGTPFCPEPEIMGECGECEGSGKTWIEVVPVDEWDELRRERDDLRAKLAALAAV
jgi:hypothetical protein